MKRYEIKLNFQVVQEDLFAESAPVSASTPPEVVRYMAALRDGPAVARAINTNCGRPSRAIQ
jgi:hypothetical protein